MTKIPLKLKNYQNTPKPYKITKIPPLTPKKTYKVTKLPLKPIRWYKYTINLKNDQNAPKTSKMIKK